MTKNKNKLLIKLNTKSIMSDGKFNQEMNINTLKLLLINTKMKNITIMLKIKRINVINKSLFKVYFSRLNIVCVSLFKCFSFSFSYDF